ncbi:MAG: purine-nucleoside phosphorylase [Bacteroidota bacterium]|nr:purine-nucleoside phosphorylase [Bacteroidota bacterium]
MEKIIKAKESLVLRGIEKADIGIVLGTGLNKIIDFVEVKETIPYSEIPGFPVSTVEFHKGNLVYGMIGEKEVLLMQGRFHAYEGYSPDQIVFPLRVMKLLGVQKIFLSNAAGGINLDFKKGDLVMIEDHINLLYGNPLTGKNFDELGPRFPDMSEPYDPALVSLLQKKAGELNIELKKGVYVAVHGPNLETKAEYRYLKITGADMVGMSTVPEVIAANHMGIPCIAISVITDECDPDNLKPVKLEEIIAVANKSDEKLSRLFLETIKSL